LSTSTGSCISEARLGTVELWDLLSAGSADPGAATLPASGAYRPRKSPDFGRFALIALALRFITLNYRLPLSGAGRGFLGPALLSVLVPTWLPTEVAPAHAPSIAPRWLLDHLPVRRAYCQLGCLDVWQKCHERTPTLLKTKDLLVRLDHPSSTALPYEASQAFGDLQMSAAWLWPRGRSRCEGTGTATSAASAESRRLAPPARRSRNYSPSGPS